MKIEKKLSLLLLSVGLIACGPAGKQAPASPGNAPSDNGVATLTTPGDANIFHLPEVPLLLTDSDRRLEYLACHYWDCMDAVDTLLSSHQAEVEQAWANYCDLLRHIPLPRAQEALKTLLPKLEKNQRVYVHFKSLAEKYLDDPNSPYRNEEFYIPILESMTESVTLDDMDKLRPRERLKLALRNRKGTRAADFTYTDTGGRKGTLRRAAATEYTLLFFHEPGCPSCAATLEMLSGSDVVNKWLAAHRLTLLAMYAGDEKEEWLRHAADFSPAWLNGYDETGEIRLRRVYDVRATPSLYLLDRDRTVLLKDATAEEVVDMLEKRLRAEIRL